jgi:DeoR/GlpR family transcriptional regulator of sugar metabolism
MGIWRRIVQQQRAGVADLCAAFQVSEATVRRDLEALAEQGKIQRVHGGAIAVTQAPPEMPALERGGEQAEAKRAIGRAAAGLVLDGETIFLGSGTTVLEMTRHLSERRGCTIITNSLMVVNALSGLAHITVVSLGGMLRSSELSFIGHITEQSLGQLRADRVFIGIRAVSGEHGLMNDYLPETMTDRAILTIGRQVVLLADHTKVGRVAPAFLAPLSSVHVLVTDGGLAPDQLGKLQSGGLRVITV